MYVNFFVTVRCFICGSLNVHLKISALLFVNLANLLGRLMEIHYQFIVLH